MPVCRAVVGYNHQAKCVWTPSGGFNCTGLISASTRTDENGQFLVNGLPAGTFILCAGARNLINSCWKGQSRYITLQSGENNTTLEFMLSAGTVLRFHVFDRDNAMQSGFGIGVGVQRLKGGLAVFGIFRDSASAPPNYTFSTGIPRDESVRLYCSAGFPVILLNEVGESIPSSGASMSVQGGPDFVDVNLTLTTMLVNAASYTPG